MLHCSKSVPFFGHFCLVSVITVISRQRDILIFVIHFLSEFVIFGVCVVVKVSAIDVECVPGRFRFHSFRVFTAFVRVMWNG